MQLAHTFWLLIMAFLASYNVRKVIANMYSARSPESESVLTLTLILTLTLTLTLALALTLALTLTLILTLTPSLRYYNSYYCDYELRMEIPWPPGYGPLVF